MKNILKKLGILVLTIAVLAPFLKLPVKADSGDCKNYVVNYLFMDKKPAALPWDPYLGTGYRTFTSFLYDYPEVQNGQKLTVKSISFNDLGTKEELEAFYNNFKELASDVNIPKSNLDAFGNFKNESGTNVSFSNKDITEYTYLLHGQWARVDENAQIEDYEEDLKDLELVDFKNATIQGALINSGKTSVMDDFIVSLGGASLTTSSGNVNKYTLANSYGTNSTLINYFQKVINDVNGQYTTSDSYKNNYVWGNDITKEKYINLSISRAVTSDFLDGITFGREYNNKLYAFSTSSSSITNSFDAYEKWFDVAVPHYDTANPWDGTNDMAKTGCAIVTNGSAAEAIPNEKTNVKPECYWIEADEDEVTINTSAGNYYHPYVLAVEYSVCSNTTDTSEKWTLQYDANTDDTTVTGTPSSQSANVNSSITVLDGPKRDNYKFVKWCVKADGSDDYYEAGDCYKAGDSIKSTLATTVTLYAQWAEKGTTDNNDTGIATYLLSFVAVGAIAGGIYLVAKKKNLFKQI